MPPDLTAILLLAPIAFLGSFVYGVTGFGTGLITIPLASHFFELPFVLATFALIDIVNAVRVFTSQPAALVREEAVRLMPSCMAGVGLGVVLLLALPAWVLMLALGCFVLVYATYSLCFPSTLPTAGTQWAYVAGLSGGVASAMFGAGAPPFAIYLSMRPHSKEQIRATLVATSIVSIGTRIVAFAIAGLLSSVTVWLTALAALPACLVALWLAERVHTVMSREVVIRAIRILLCVAGASLVFRALSA